MASTPCDMTKDDLEIPSQTLSIRHSVAGGHGKGNYVIVDSGRFIRNSVRLIVPKYVTLVAPDFLRSLQPISSEFG